MNKKMFLLSGWLLIWAFTLPCLYAMDSDFQYASYGAKLVTTRFEAHDDEGTLPVHVILWKTYSDLSKQISHDVMAPSVLANLKKVLHSAEQKLNQIINNVDIDEKQKEEIVTSLIKLISEINGVVYGYCSPATVFPLC